jgi:hypothetical protein
MFSAAAFAGIVSDSNLGYAITLPASWVQLKTKPNQHYFRDGSKLYGSQISILKYEIDKATYPTPENWSQAQFIAYKLSVETSAFPFGAVEFYDTSSTAKLGAYWSPEAFSILYPADGDPTYCEFIRYCAVGNVGYEIYAIGDSADMMKNVDIYAGIIATLQFTAPAASIAPVVRDAVPSWTSVHIAPEYDLVGRKLPHRILPARGPSATKQRLVSLPAR